VLLCGHLKSDTDVRKIEVHQLPKRMNTLQAASANLLLEHFFDLPDYFLNFAGVLFSIAFGL